MHNRIIWVLALALVMIAATMDWKSRRIPNWLTLSGFCAGLAANAFVRGWSGLELGLVGAGAMFLVLLPVVMLRGLGAGDWKLMGALGAVMGLRDVSSVLLIAIVVSGVMAVAQMIWQRRVIQTLSNLWELLKGFFIYGLQPHPEIQLGNPQASKLPFGVAAAVATLICVGIGTIRP